MQVATPNSFTWWRFRITMYPSKPPYIKGWCTMKSLRVSLTWNTSSQKKRERWRERVVEELKWQVIYRKVCIWAGVLSNLFSSSIMVVPCIFCYMSCVFFIKLNINKSMSSPPFKNFYSIKILNWHHIDKKVWKTSLIFECTPETSSLTTTLYTQESFLYLEKAVAIVAMPNLNIASRCSLFLVQCTL